MKLYGGPMPDYREPRVWMTAEGRHQLAGPIT